MHGSFSLVESPNGNTNPECRKGCKDERSNGDKSTPTNTGLPRVDTEEGPSDGDCTSEITLGGRECVSDCGGFEDGESEEDEYFGPHSGSVRVCVTAKGFKASDKDEDGDPSVSEGEGEVDKD